MVSDTMLKGEQITKYFGGLAALNNVDFQVYKGEILGLIGPNGAGKTTLFNVISGVYKPTKGKVYFDGKDVTKLRADQKCKMGIGRTYQTIRLFNSMKVIDNVASGALFGRDENVDTNEAYKIAVDALKFVELDSKKDIPVKDLNLIERKFVEVARALATGPKIILLDEPLNGLNPVEIKEASKLVERIRNELEITVFWIEHVMRAIMNVAERIIVLNYGEKIAEGTPEEVARDAKVIKAYLGEEV